MKSMTFEQFADTEDYNEIIDEMYWEDNYSSERLFERTILAATKEGVIITDKDDCDYDGYFWNVWQCTEKGLS